MGEPRQVMNNGVLVWQVNRVITERVWVENADGTRSEVKNKVRLRGTAPTKNLARQRLEQKYKEYLVKTGELPVEALGLAPTAVSITLGEWLETWLQRRSTSGELQGSSLKRYKSNIQNHILPVLGSKPLRLLTLADVNHLLLDVLPNKKKQRKNPETGLLEDTEKRLLGNSPLRMTQDIMTAALKMAVVEGKVRSNPMDGFKRISKTGMDDDKRASLSEFRQLPAQIIRSLYGTPELGWWVLALIGLRQNERLGVEWSSFVNLEDRSKPAELYINRQLWYDEELKTFHIKHRTKSPAGERILILPEHVREPLLFWKAKRLKMEKDARKQGKWKPVKGLENLVFTTATGQPVRHQTDGNNFKRMLRTAGLRDDAWLHAMRHMVATELGIQGVHPEFAKLVLGHGSSAMTAFYQHYGKFETATPLGQISEAFHTAVPAIVRGQEEGSLVGRADDFYDALLEGRLPELEPVSDEQHKATLLHIAKNARDLTEEEVADLVEFSERQDRATGVDIDNSDRQTVELDEEPEFITVIVDALGDIQPS